MTKSWITQKYPKGTRITVPSRTDPNATVGAEVINHVTGGFNNSRIVGIIVRDDAGNVYNIEAGFLDEQGGGV